MAEFLAGETLTADALNNATVKTIARGHRTTNKASITTEVGFLRIDDVPMVANRLYRVAVGPMYVTSSVANDEWIARLRWTADGSTPTTSSATLDLAVSQEGQSTNMEAYLSDVTGFTFSVMITLALQTGTGSLTLDATSQPVRLVIQDIGPDPGNVGVAL